MQFETYREIALKALKRATVNGERPPEAVTYIISMQEEMEKVLSKNSPQDSEKEKKRPRTNKDQQQILDQRTGESIPFPNTKFAPRAGVAGGQIPAVSPVVMVLPASKELKLDLDRFLPDEGTMRVRIRAGRSTMQPDLLPCHLDAVLKLFLRFYRSLYRRALLLQIGLMSQHLQRFWSRAYLSAELFSENSGYWPRLKAIPSKISDSQAMNSDAPTALRISESTKEPAPITSTRPGCI